MEEPTDLFKEEGYLLEEPLASDCWGDLYRARYVPHDREVLFRRFSTGVGEDAAAWELARAEIQAWARLDHPGILQVLDWGKADPGAYLATAMPGGSPLGELIGRDEGVERPGEAFKSLLLSVEVARQWGVLHLGLGLTTIWVCEEGAVEVSEFGLWYVTREFAVPEIRDDFFAAPEQSGGERVSAATDVYTLGLLFIALHHGLARAREAAEGRVIPEGPEGSRPVLARCLDERPLARYRSPGEIARAMGFDPEQWLHEEYRDCPLCRLRSELERESARGEPGTRAYARGTSRIPYQWVAILALAVVTFLVWWVALR